MRQVVLKDGWYTVGSDHLLDMNSSGIYEWRIDGVGVYIGKALQLRKRIRAYPNNVRRIIEGLPWHGNPERKYRRIHIALREAHDCGTPVVVSVLEICAPELRAAREAHWIAVRRGEHSAGGLRVLND